MAYILDDIGAAMLDIPADFVNVYDNNPENDEELGWIGSGNALQTAIADVPADFGNAALGIDAPDMGLFESDAAGGRSISVASMGLAGEGGFLTEPGQFAENVFGGGQQGQEQQSQASGLGAILTSPIVLIGLAAAAAAVVLGGDW